MYRPLSRCPRSWHLVAVALAVILALAIACASAEAAFPGANGKIAFTSFRDGNSEILSMNADGTGQTNLTRNPAADFDAAWSPDGTKIAFESLRDGNWDVYVMNADGTGVTRLTSNPAFDGLPSWSPDGSKIAFHSGRGGNFDIYVMNADGTEQTNLTMSASSERDAAWSPDGRKIAFWSDRDGDYEVYVMNADGSAQTNLTNNPDPNDQVPAWSPDGTKIAFQSSRNGNFEIYVMNADGTGQANLTNSLGTDSDAAWSPDGTKIAFTSSRDGNNEIYVMNADGTGQTRITNNTGSDGDPDWQPIPYRPATIALDPADSAGPLGASHAIQAMVRDMLGRPAGGLPVRFLVSGSTRAAGPCITAGDGTCTFSYSGPLLPGDDEIYAYADLDGSGTQEAGEPATSATRRWLAGAAPKPEPRVQRGCKSRRMIVLRLPRRMKRAKVKAAGRTMRIFGSRRPRALVDLRGLPRRHVRVHIRVITASGKRIHRHRMFWTCTERPRTA